MSERDFRATGYKMQPRRRNAEADILNFGKRHMVCGRQGTEQLKTGVSQEVHVT